MHHTSIMLILVEREILTNALKTLAKNPVKESFDITFMGNEKICQNIIFFFLFHKTFF